MTTIVPYTPPAHECKSFNCAHCGAYANQQWSPMFVHNGRGFVQVPDWSVAACANCARISAWRLQTMVFPSGGNAPLPNPDLPEDIRQDYEEARAIAAISPRGAAALLRLGMQKLCKHLGQDGKNINDDIANLVATGLPPGVQKALDVVRVIGNEAVHPGQIDLRDDPDVASALFGLVNFVAEKTITEPREIDAIYGMLPPSKQAQIERRDRKA